MKTKCHSPKGINMNNRGCKPTADANPVPRPRRGRTSAHSTPPGPEDVGYLLPPASPEVMHLYSLRENPYRGAIAVL